MGGNKIVLLNGKQIPAGQELRCSLAALRPLRLDGHQAGVLYQEKQPNWIRTKIVTITGEKFIGMCGGLTQVLGKALEIRPFREFFSLNLTKPSTHIGLKTDSGPVQLEVKWDGKGVRKTETAMDSFISECYRVGVHPITVAGVEAFKVGNALCVEAQDLYEGYPDTDLENLDEKTLEALREVQCDFLNQWYPDLPGVTFAVYDRRPDSSGDIRVIFPHQIKTGHVEPACGTGTTIVGLAMVEKGQVLANGKITIRAESGGDLSSIGGSEQTTLNLQVKSQKVKSAKFSHDLVQTLAYGRLLL